MLHDPQMQSEERPAEHHPGSDAVDRSSVAEVVDTEPKMWGGSNPGSCVVARLLRWATRNNRS